MDKENLQKITKKEIQRHMLRVRLATVFFGVVTSFLVIIGITAYIVTQFGISSEHFKNPVFFMGVIAWLCVVLASIASYYLMRKIFAPLEQLSEASLQVGKGDFSVQLDYDGHLQELGNTIENFNRMVKELNSVEIMRNDFVADVSHEFKTPLSAITG